MKNKKWLLVLIIIIPSALWVALESSEINSRKLAYYGPKKNVSKTDTQYYSISDVFLKKYAGDSVLREFKINSVNYPLYIAMFVKPEYVSDSYRLAGLWEYLNYKKDKLENIPFFLITESFGTQNSVQDSLSALCDNKNVQFLSWNKNGFDSLRETYFLQKPVYVDKSFFVLVDENRNIRGYYDGRYVAEIKRLIEEYKHLRLKEAKQKLINENEIKTNT